MEIINFSFDTIWAFSKTDSAYQSEAPPLRSFYKYAPRIDSFEQVIADKSIPEGNRQILASVVRAQYENCGLQVPENVDKLSETDTYTVTTAHQPSLFTGPLYTILKIAGTINLARKLSDSSDKHIVPIFIMGGEDHDFEEINHLALFGQSFEWAHPNPGGSVGRMSNEGLEEICEAIKEKLGNSPHAEDLKEKLTQATKGAKNYGEVAFRLISYFFEGTELVIVSMDDPKLKALLKNVMRHEILEEGTSSIVRATQEKIEKEGFQPQAFVRDINFFYLTENRRDRIEKDGNAFRIVDTDIQFSEAEMSAEIEAHPERFSPNVIMRPIYQETVLPNLAYIGGGGELAYWLERKEQFEHYDLNFPMLIRRNSVLWMDRGSVKQWRALDLNFEDLFMEEESLIKQWVSDNTEAELNVSDELKMIAQAYEGISAKAKEVDPTLSKAILAEQTKVLKTTEQLGGRLIRSQKQKFEVRIGRIRKVKSKLFPGNGLQERKENFMSIYLKHGVAATQYLIDHLDPLDKNFKLILESD